MTCGDESLLIKPSHNHIRRLALTYTFLSPHRSRCPNTRQERFSFDNSPLDGLPDAWLRLILPNHRSTAARQMAYRNNHFFDKPFSKGYRRLALTYASRSLHRSRCPNTRQERFSFDKAFLKSRSTLGPHLCFHITAAQQISE